MLHEAAAAGTRPIGIRIRERCRPEHFAPAPPPPQAIRRVEGMTGFVAQDAHEPVAVAPFHFAHETPLDAAEARMRKIEGDGDAGNAVGREPLLRQPAVRPKTDAAGGEFSIQPPDRLLEIRARDRQSEITKSQTKQLLVAQRLPGMLQPRARVRERRRFSGRFSVATCPWMLVPSLGKSYLQFARAAFPFAVIEVSH